MFSTSDSSLQLINTISVCQALKFILLSSLKRYPYFLLLWEIGWMSTLNPVPTYKVILDIYLLFFIQFSLKDKSFLLKKCLQFVKRKSWESLEHFLNTYLLQLSRVFTSPRAFIEPRSISTFPCDKIMTPTQSASSLFSLSSASSQWDETSAQWLFLGIF